jgi:hypothetical protein
MSLAIGLPEKGLICGEKLIYICKRKGAKTITVYCSYCVTNSGFLTVKENPLLNKMVSIVYPW